MVYKFKKYGQESQRTVHIVFDFKARSHPATLFADQLLRDGLKVPLELGLGTHVKVEKVINKLYRTCFRAITQNNPEANSQNWARNQDAADNSLQNNDN